MLPFKIQRGYRGRKDNHTAISAMTLRPRRLVLVAFDGLEPLDLAGPASVFARANLQEPGTYELLFASPLGGSVSTLCGLAFSNTLPLAAVRKPFDTILVAGGSEAGLRKAVFEQGVASWLATAAPCARRVASVCVGAFILGAAGLLDGRRATTHWASCDRLRTYFPRARVEADSIFIADGPVWTSAGITAGIDLALAMVEADVGTQAAATIAKQLVLFLRRSGGQAQFSETLAAQARSSGLSKLIAWATEHPDADLSVPALAARAAMSERTLARRFVQEVGRSPAKFVMELRLTRAKTLLERSDLPIVAVAARSGFGSVDALQRAFRTLLNITPGAYRDRFSAGTAVIPL
jgi:transcriptional regulator GlxA family with amidase domain